MDCQICYNAPADGTWSGYETCGDCRSYGEWYEQMTPEERLADYKAEAAYVDQPRWE